jgi:hypothetical protein
LYLRTGASGGEVYRKTDDGSSTNWTLLSSGTTGWLVNASISGADGNETANSFEVINNSAFVLTNNESSATGALAAKIACDAAASTGTTCSGGETLGIAFTPPISGPVEVCFTPGGWDHRSTNVAALKLAITGNSNNTIVTDGNQIRSSQNTTGSPAYADGNVCEIFDMNAGTEYTVRAFTKLVAGSGTNQFLCNGTNASCTFTARPASLQAVASNVSSGRTNGVKIWSASITNSGSAAISSQDGSWISSVSRIGGGVVTVNFTGGVFSVAPRCWCQTYGGGRACDTGNGSKPTTSGGNFYTWNASGGGALSDEHFEIFCLDLR